MPPSLINIINHWLFKVFIGILVFYLLLAHFAINPIAKKAVPWAAKKYLNSQASVASVRFNPWRNQLTIDGFALRNQKEEPLIGFEQLFIDLEADGVFKRAWKFKALRLRAPKTLFVQKADQKNNWSELLAALNKPDSKPEPSTVLPRVIVQSLAIFEGQFTYQDHRHAEQLKETLLPIDITLSDFSTLPNQQGSYHLAARLPDDKGQIAWQGDLSVSPLASSGNITLSALNLPNVLSLLRPSTPIEVTHGKATLTLAYALNETLPDAKAATPSPSDATDQLQVAAASKKQPPAYALGLTDVKLQANKLAAALPSGVTIEQQALTLDVPEIKVVFGANAGLTLADAKVQLDDLHVRTTQSDDLPLSLPQVQINQVGYDLSENRLNIGSLVLDQADVKVVRTQSGQVDWQSFFAMPKQAEAEQESAEQKMPEEESVKQAALAEAATDKVSETATPANEVAKTDDSPAKAETKPFALVVNDVHLNQWQLHLLDQTFVDAMSVSTPTLNSHFTVNFDEAVQQISKLSLNIEGVAMHSGKQALVKLHNIALQDGLVDLIARQLTIPAVESSRLEVPITLSANQALNWDGVFKQHAAPVSQQTPTKAEPETTAWQWRIGRYALTNSRIMLTDTSHQEPFHYNVEDLSLTVDSLSQALNQALPITLAFKLASGGRVNVKGKLAPTPLNVNLSVALDQLQIKPFTHYVNQYAALKLDYGLLSIQGDVALKKQQNVTMAFDGGFALNKLSILEENKTPFLKWDAMKGEAITFQLAPKQLTVGTISIDKPVGKFLIAADKSLNLTQVLHKQESTRPATPSKDTASEQAGFPMRIDKVTVNAAELDFEDLSLRPQFGTHINTLNGVINGLSTDKKAQAKLAFEGKVEQYGVAKIEGSLRPFEPTAATDIALHFKNLAMEKLTPYSGKFAGRKIDSGKLDVDLKYLIKDQQLKGENKVEITKIKLGDQIDSPDAADLPLDLAIAILQDNQGVIDLDLPVKGDLNDPEFDYGSVIWKAFTGLLTKVITAPFKVLGKLLGDGDKALDHIAFDAGKAEITPPSAEILDALAESLQKRQHLSLVVNPSYQRKQDTEALKTMRVREAIAAKIQEDDAEKSLDGPINLSDATTQKAVKALHDALMHKSLLKRLSDRFDELPPEYYENAYAELIAAVKVDDTTLTTLATVRGEAVRKHLTAHNVAPDRIVLKAPQASDKNETVFEIDLGKTPTLPANSEPTLKEAL